MELELELQAALLEALPGEPTRVPEGAPSRKDASDTRTAPSAEVRRRLADTKRPTAIRVHVQRRTAKRKDATLTAETDQNKETTRGRPVSTRHRHLQRWVSLRPALTVCDMSGSRFRWWTIKSCSPASLADSGRPCGSPEQRKSCS